jgi:hypothetical protein
MPSSHGAFGSTNSDCATPPACGSSIVKSGEVSSEHPGWPCGCRELSGIADWVNPIKAKHIEFAARPVVLERRVAPIHGRVSARITIGPAALLQPVPNGAAVGMHVDCRDASPYAIVKPAVWKLPPTTTSPLLRCTIV